VELAEAVGQAGNIFWILIEAQEASGEADNTSLDIGAEVTETLEAAIKALTTRVRNRVWSGTGPGQVFCKAVHDCCQLKLAGPEPAAIATPLKKRGSTT
jgi:hypothetical protein